MNLTSWCDKIGSGLGVFGLAIGFELGLFEAGVRVV